MNRRHQDDENNNLINWLELQSRASAQPRELAGFKRWLSVCITFQFPTLGCVGLAHASLTTQGKLL
ncbi:hypothetical protein Pla52nx_002428 [Stieleria varia]|uniref:hypothetical protein n=1 Tax=Stieleria varia TaxID=2528005 RepID=UPI0011B438AD